jgi:hypothetical protein
MKVFKATELYRWVSVIRRCGFYKNQRYGKAKKTAFPVDSGKAVGSYITIFSYSNSRNKGALVAVIVK